MRKIRETKMMKRTKIMRVGEEEEDKVDDRGREGA